MLPKRIRAQHYGVSEPMRRTFALRKLEQVCARLGVIAISVLFAGLPAQAQPVVQLMSGALNHGSSITISGSGFGSKSTAAPLVWDDASGNNILDKWDGAWPFQLPGYNLAYYAPMRGVSPPHSHDSRYIAGAHAGNSSAYAGYDVVFFKNFVLQPFPFYIYASWYQRADPDWVFGGDNNYKTFAYSVCCSPYELPHDWFTAYGPPRPGSVTDKSAQWLYTDNSDSLMNPDANGHYAWWGTAVNPMTNWSKVEIAVKVTNQKDGSIKVWENGQQVMNYAGPTDRYAGNQRTVGIGGFARMQVPQNWRYFADAYLDLTLARVVLANNPVLAKATVIENQIPSAWSDGAITATVNLGHFNAGDTAYLFVVDSSGTPNATGLAVTAGGGGNAPQAPSGVAVH